VKDGFEDRQPPFHPIINCTSPGIGNTIGLSHLPPIDKVYTNLTDKLDRCTVIFITTVKLSHACKKGWKNMFKYK
jgi:hypothetical protein